MALISTGAAIGGALIGGAARLGSTLFGNRARRKEQRRVEQREDTAIQRRVADLQAAGLSPTLAAGSAATTAAPPQIENPDLGGMDPAQMVALKQGMADVGLTEANADLARTMTREHSIAADLKQQDLDFGGKTFEDRVKMVTAELSGQNIHNARESLEHQLRKDYGRDFYELEKAAKNMQNEITARFGIEGERARVAALKLANEQGQHNLAYAKKNNMPVGSAITDWEGSLERLGGRARDIMSVSPFTGRRTRNPFSRAERNRRGGTY